MLNRPPTHSLLETAGKVARLLTKDPLVVTPQRKAIKNLYPTQVVQWMRVPDSQNWWYKTIPFVIGAQPHWHVSGQEWTLQGLILEDWSVMDLHPS
jgi:hypothetical protein